MSDAGIVVGTVSVPGDKSISHRALMVAALARGQSTIRGILQSDDIESTARALRAIGAGIAPLGPQMVIEGCSAWHHATGDVDCGNSGTTTRLMAGVVAGLGLRARFVGDASLSTRPMERVAAPLRLMGATVSCDAVRSTLPMTVEGGALTSIRFDSPTSSAQVKSALLLAAVCAGVRCTVCERHRSRDHTERMLHSCGVPIDTTEGCVSVPEGRHALTPLALDVPGDPSSAAFFVALAARAGSGSLQLTNTLLNPTRTGFLSMCRRMGVAIEIANERSAGGEPVGDIVVHAGHPLRAVSVEAGDVPAMIDELPLLACLAASATGTTVIRGAAELRVKESDRIAVTVANLRALGVAAEELPDGLRVTGNQQPLRGRILTHDDHRIAMAFGVLAARPGNAIVIDRPDCVRISFPGFWSELHRVCHPA